MEFDERSVGEGIKWDLTRGFGGIKQTVGLIGMDS